MQLRTKYTGADQENGPAKLRTEYTSISADQMTIEEDGPSKSRWKMWIEILVTSVGIAVIWGLLSLPSVFYFLPRSGENMLPQPIKTGCVNYTASVCLQDLIQSKPCFPGVQQNSSNVAIASNVDQVANENTAQFLIDDLYFLGASETCRSSFIPFMCLYLFPLCDGNGTAHKPSRNQCIETHEAVCKDWWQKALNFPNKRDRLPNCESLSVTTESVCKGQDTSGNRSVAMNKSSSSTQMACKDTFYISSGRCVPQCGQWKLITDEMAVAVTVLVIISALVGIVFGIIVTILSCISRKKM